MADIELVLNLIKRTISGTIGLRLEEYSSGGNEGLVLKPAFWNDEDINLNITDNDYVIPTDEIGYLINFLIAYKAKYKEQENIK